MKLKLSLVAIVSTSAIAGGVLFGSVSSAQPCEMSKLDYYQETYDQPDWLRSPWAILITLPGIALATALSVGGRSYQN